MHNTRSRVTVMSITVKAPLHNFLMSAHGFIVSSFLALFHSLSDRWLAQGSPCTLPLLHPYILLCSNTVSICHPFSTVYTKELSRYNQYKGFDLCVVCGSSVKLFCSQILAKSQRGKGSRLCTFIQHTTKLNMQGIIYTGSEYTNVVPSNT